jgi:2-polyprenyl-3-methyl-5-hydroxy-6-metoxy-1,4-benzoquinol methylase
MKGGKKEERLYLNDFHSMKIIKTEMPNMRELVARHRSRYHLAAFIARPGMKVLDFPCGSGYGCEIVEDVEYHGMDNDEITIEYAKYYYP